MSNRKLLSHNPTSDRRLKITDFRLMHRDTELHLAVKLVQERLSLPGVWAARPDRAPDDRVPAVRRTWPSWACASCSGTPRKRSSARPTGVVQEEIPWAPPHARVTYRLEWRLCALCQIMTQKAAAEILRLPTSTLSNLLHRVITRVRRRHTIRGLTTLGVDEISYCKGRKFATLVYDLDRARVLWVGQGKGRDTIDRSSTTG